MGNAHVSLFHKPVIRPGKNDNAYFFRILFNLFKGVFPHLPHFIKAGLLPAECFFKCRPGSGAIHAHAHRCFHQGCSGGIHALSHLDQRR